MWRRSWQAARRTDRDLRPHTTLPPATSKTTYRSATWRLGSRSGGGWQNVEEAGAALAGDHLITAPDLTATRAITIHAPADLIWPWIAQLGQDRGGFYSYDWLENLLGLDMHSADRVGTQPARRIPLGRTRGRAYRRVRPLPRRGRRDALESGGADYPPAASQPGLACRTQAWAPIWIASQGLPRGGV